MDSEQEYTTDTLFGGRLTCLQHRHGYRFSVDAVLLARFLAPHQGARVLDLGAGCGIISLILAYRRPDLQLIALELQPALAGLIRRNIEINEPGERGISQRIKVVNGDLCGLAEYIRPGTQDWVVCNPPYRKQGSGRRNLDSEQALARHEIRVDLEAIISAAVSTVKTGGRVAMIYPAARMVSLLHVMRSKGLEPKRLQMVYSFPGSDARLFLVESVKGGGEELKVLSPFYIYRQPGGGYTQEMARCYEP